jgi:hypothetical protein
MSTEHGNADDTTVAAGSSRREFLHGLGGTLGALALQSLLRAESGPARVGPLTPRPPHHQARAKRCVFLFMEGGPSHIDTFDPKPKLRSLHMKKFNRKGRFASAMASGQRYFVESPFRFVRAGDSGADMCEHWRHLSSVADELCFYRGLQAESINHPTACYHMNTGNRFGGDPALGAWTCYGLGSPNQDLPGYVVLPAHSHPQGGAANWSNGFLPPHYQGTALRAKGSPILDLAPPPGVTKQVQRANLDLLAKLNESHRTRHPGHEELAARAATYDLACRMQPRVPSLGALSREDEATRELYGLGDPTTHDFARQCLLARRLLEQGVRFVQLYATGWDSHDYLERAHRSRIHAVDKPIAALITDLRRRGMLDDTLIVWCGEFGRSPDNGLRGGGREVIGRDHNKNAMAVWLAGGGVKAGHTIGATDDIGERAVEVARPIKDFHVTLLHLLGLDDNQLTFFHGGRFKQISQTGGTRIDELLA